MNGRTKYMLIKWILFLLLSNVIRQLEFNNVIKLLIKRDVLRFNVRRERYLFTMVIYHKLPLNNRKHRASIKSLQSVVKFSL